MTSQQGAPEALPDPSPDKLRAIARTARNSSGSASDDCGPLAYVLHGWRAAAIAIRAHQAALVETQQPAPSEQQPFGWIKQSEIDSSNDFCGSINLWRRKYDCDVPVYLAQQAAPSAAVAEILELLECSGCLKVGQKDRALAIVARLLPAQHGGVL